MDHAFSKWRQTTQKAGRLHKFIHGHRISAFHSRVEVILSIQLEISNMGKKNAAKRKANEVRNSLSCSLFRIKHIDLFL